jgi:cytochrome bd-type quinol oxidase subunit 1
MNYPAWDVPLIGSGWVIGAIAIFHILISHFAVGGGLYLALAESQARRRGLTPWLGYLKRHSYFFLVLTGVYGAVTGVAIWFAIGLAHPEGTSALIHNFVFAWAIEWVFFIIELTSAAVYYYTWDRIPGQLHLKVGWLYAISSLFTLVIINGILTFMLTPGQAWLSVAGTGQEASMFWQALFNPTYWPSLAMRSAVCCSLAGIFALVTASRLDIGEEIGLKTCVVRWSCWWLFPAFAFMPLGFLWYLWSVPETNRDLLLLGVTTIGQGTFSQVTRSALVSVTTSATILGVVYFIAYQRPASFCLGHALAILAIALAATASTEYARELLRKPYVISLHMYASSVRKAYLAKYNTEGYLAHSPWIRPEERLRWQNHRLRTQADQIECGRLMFLGQCSCCHTLDGYRSLKVLLANRNHEAIVKFLEILHENKTDQVYHKFMPPLVGLPEERAALADYLATYSVTAQK